MQEDKTNTENEEIKVLFLGESGVGKTNIIKILIGCEFNDNENATTSSNYTIKNISLENKEYKLNLWQTISQQRMRQLT